MICFGLMLAFGIDILRGLWIVGQGRRRNGEQDGKDKRELLADG